MERLSLLVSDLDGTLLGDDKALEQFVRWCDARSGQFRLAYDSGRFFDDVSAVVTATGLAEPDVIIGGVGTEMRHYPGGEAVVDDWPRLIGPWDRDQIRAELAACPQLQPQPDHCQASLKLSYYACDADTSLLVNLRRRLQMAGQCADLVYSSARDLDVLPAGVNKGAAAAALALAWNLRPKQVVVAGDTGNDVSMFVRGFRGIVVANAHDELKTLRSREVYFAREPFAAGVVEGLEYWLAKEGA